MRVKDLMIRDITTCTPSTDLAAVAMMMWNKDCGVVPVTDGEGKPVGVITDRDISIAGATQGRSLSAIPVSAVKDGQVVTCKPDEDVKEALALMATAKVRRLPVVDEEGRVTGILSLGDIIARAPDGGLPPTAGELPSDFLMRTLKSVYVHH